MNTPVSFDIAKLLKEKGFDEPCSEHWEWGDGDKKHGASPGVFIGGFCDNEGNYRPYTNSELMETYKDNEGDVFGEWTRPIISEVVMWLREKHGIWIYVECEVYGESWFPKVLPASRDVWANLEMRSKIQEITRHGKLEYNSPTEAYSAAIEYSLKNLI